MAKAFATKYKGIRYREHKTRKNGVRYDKYFTVRYRMGGTLKEEGWGWESEGFTASSAFIEREKIMLAIKAGDEVATLAERRAEAERLRSEKLAVADAEARGNITFDAFFQGVYKEHRDPKALVPELPLYQYWVKPVIGNKTFADITELDMTKIKKLALKADRSLRTIEYCYSTVRMIFNMAATHGIYHGDCPVTKAIRQGIKYDNRKTRYLTPDEAHQLLAALNMRSKQTHDMALLSLYCGLRAGEVLGLDWSDVNVNDKTITLRDTKSSRTRIVPMPEQVQEMFSGYKRGTGNVPVFVNVKGERFKKISKTFPRTVVELGFNQGVTDRRQKVVFHSLRHSFASWLVQAGVPLLTVQKLLGHSTIRMTERYSHLAPDNLKQAADVLSSMASAGPAAEKVVNIK